MKSRGHKHRCNSELFQLNQSLSGTTPMKEKQLNIFIAIVSVAVPLLVFSLFYLKPPEVKIGFDLSIIPAFNAAINFTVTLLLIVGYIFMKKKMIPFHKYTMITAFSLSSLFLISYVIYHTLAVETHFGGEGWIRPVYFTLLITHIILAAAIVPMILFTLTRGLQSRFDKHRRIAKWTWPLWLYVSVTGVLVYLMLSPYYQH